MLDQLQLSDFKHLEGTWLPIRFEPEVTLEAELLEATEIKGHSPLNRKPFLLLFRTAQIKDYYPQGMYTLVHPEKGEIPLFFVTLGLDEKGTKYEATFS